MRERNKAIRAKTFRAWFKANLREYARDIAEHGADCGYPHITYTSDTCRIFDKFAEEIWEMVVEQADSAGENPAEYISQFRRADMLDNWDSFRNLMVWFACEEVAREMTDKERRL